MQDFVADGRPLLIAIGIFAGAIFVALLVHWSIFALLTAVLRRKENKRYELLFTKRAKRPAAIIFPLLALSAALPFAPVAANIKVILQHLLALGVIASIGWAIIIAAELTGDIVFIRYTTDASDNLSARRIRTQTQVLQRISIFLVSVVTVAIMLMTIPTVRHIGTSLLASAGLAGLVVGVAARSTLSNLIAGLQVALTQPIRIDDAVVLEGEWGWIEEITTTYVVVRLWDLRRLIVPLSYIIEKPFQNWTRTIADILATVILFVDYTLPIPPVREELHRILKKTELWDKKVWALQVTDATEGTMQIRALMSARNGPSAFDLRCYVREQLIEFIRDNYPESLPRQRLEELLKPQ